MIGLSPRLKTVAGLVEKGARPADVGTDHARLPIWLVQNGIVERAVASDLRPGPLAHAAETVGRCGLGDRIRLVLCDGLDGIDPDDTDTVVLAGMGGETIRDILARAHWVKQGARRLILQPMTAADTLRGFLYENGFMLLDERLTLDAGRVYQTLCVCAGHMELTHPAQLYTGIFLKKEPLFGGYIDRLIRRFEKAARDYCQSCEIDASREAYFQTVLEGLRQAKGEWLRDYGGENL